MSAKSIYAINPDRKKPWNGLPLLPVDESLYKTIPVLEQLGKAKAAMALLKGRSAVIPNQGMLINTISLQEAKDSSEIENIFTTEDELYKAYSQNRREEVRGPAKEVLHYREALWKGYEYMQDRDAFDMGYLTSVFREIKQTKDGIRPAHVPVYIKQGGSGSNAGQPVYTPPQGKGVVEEKMDNLLTFINNETDNIDSLLKIAIGHAQFEAIHPFRDGNGRTGRVFNIQYLVHRGLLEIPILYMSRYIIENKEAYYMGLMGITQRGDWETWVLYMLKALEVTSHITYNKINDIYTVMKSIRQVIAEQTDIRQPEKMIEAIFTQPFTRVKHFTEKKIYAENTARNYLHRLCEIGVLEKKVIQGHHYYLNIDLHRILAG